LASPAAPADVTKAAAAAGTSTSPARADHKHDISTAAPVAQTPDQTNAEGTATSLARSDHVHNIAAAAGSVGIGAGNTEGSAASFARSDHNHALRTGSTDLTMGTIADGALVRRSGSSLVGFSRNYQKTELDTTYNTTTQFPVVLLSLSVAGLTGETYRITFCGFFWSVDKDADLELYNLTDTTTMSGQNTISTKIAANGVYMSHTAYITFTSDTTKVVQLRFGAVSGGDSVNFDRHRLESERVL
jgi:hypothetical protein